MPYLLGILAIVIVVGLYLHLRSRSAEDDVSAASAGRAAAPGTRPITRPITRPGQAAPPEVSPEETRGSWLVVIQGPEKGRTYLLGERSITIGRATTNFIQLSDLETSRVHCQIRYSGTRYLVVDMSSASGTLLDGEKIETGTLKDGTRISLGNTILLFEEDASHTRDHAVERKATETNVGKSTELPGNFGRDKDGGMSLTRYLTELGQLTKMSRTNVSRAEFLQAASLVVAAHADWDRVAFLGEAPGGGWRVESFHHRARLDLSRGKLPPDKPLMIRAAETGEQQMAAPASLDSGRLHGALAIPIKRGDDVVGVSYVDRLTPRKREPNAEEIDFVRAAFELTLDLEDS